MEKAIEFEARRQIELLEDGKTVTQETRLYDAQKDETRSMRSKEDAQDYRYFPDPDLLPLVISEQDIAQVSKGLPELPKAKRERYAKEFQLSDYDAAVITESREKADYFERTVAASIPPKLAANWITGELAARLNEKNLDFHEVPIPATRFARLLALVVDGTVSQKSAKEVLAEMWASKQDADSIIQSKGLKQVSDAGAIGKIVDEVLAANEKQVADYRAGKEKAFNSLVGQVMKRTQGKANPAQVNEILRGKLKS
jgi:aspartyl-tRNA(Asn)/glutamyl-tRNA(Gln) amidotransferase subunit B